MNKIISFTLIGLAMLSNCSQPDPNQKPEKNSLALDRLVDQYHEERLKLFPLEATMVGDNRYNDLLPNTLTKAFRDQVTEFFTRYQNALMAIDRNNLSEKDRMNFDVLKWECDIALAGIKFKDYLMPINQFSSLPLMIGQLASGSSMQPFKTVKDYDDWLSRLDAYTIWCDSAVVNMRKGIQDGYTLPKALTIKVIDQLDQMAQGPVQDHLFYSPVKNFPVDFPVEENARLTKAYDDMVSTKIIPAHLRLKEFFQKEYLPSSRISSGIDAVPDGKEYYNYLIKYYTTTSKTADEIFEIGQREVDRISKEMEKVKEQVGFKGDLKSFFAHLRTKKELTPFTKPEQVIANFNAIHERMKPNLEKLFNQTPKTSFEVRRTEAFREASASAEYNPGSQDGTRPGIFYVPIPNVKQYNIISDEDLFLHEAIPGHHYQISLQQENQDLPAFRKVLMNSAYVEGWALYTESLGRELGLYTDPYQYCGMLSGEMHRAIRLVVDVGMHTKGWTREQAIQFSKDHEAETDEGIIAEIERYMAIPGQALAYKIGQLKIRELRIKAETALGARFNIAQFHNQMLNTGCIPLQVLEDKINHWIELEKEK